MTDSMGSTSRKNGAQVDPEEKKSSVLHHATLGEQPTSDAGYFELLGYAVFSAAVGDRRTVDENWPEIVYGFKSFHVQRVAEFDDNDLREIGERVPLLRNKSQLSAMVANAEAIARISQVYGSFKQYLRSFEKDGPTELLKDISDRFKLVDRNVFFEFLKSAGAEALIPDTGKPRKGGKLPRRGGRSGNQRQPKAGGGKANNGKAKSNRGGKPGAPKAERPANGQGNGRAKGRPRRRRFGFRKKKGTANSNKTEKPASAAKG